MTPQKVSRREKWFPTLSRRRFLVGSAAGIAGAYLGPWLYRHRFERGWSTQTFIAKAAGYEVDLTSLILKGLGELGFSAGRIGGLRVLLKPNLVEPFSGAGHINTNPVLVQAAAEAFLELGAQSVIVGEGPGHIRDSVLVREESGFSEMLRQQRLAYVDLNMSDVFPVPNLGGRTGLAELWFPKALKEVDLVVSLAKMKTHHWAGVTLSMKNLFGLLPGTIYGWPKNVLHFRGIEASILDIYETLKPGLAIVDGIVGMQGDGPIMGEPVNSGVLVIGANFPAVDATCARVMGIDPLKILHLAHASGSLGPILDSNIEQRGESIKAVRTDFELIDQIPAHRGVRLSPR